MSKKQSSPRFRFAFAALLLSALLFLLPAVRSGDRRLYLLAALVPAFMLLCSTVLARLFSLDRMALTLALFLCSVGIAAFAPSDPDAAVAHALRCIPGMAALLIGAVLMRSLSSSMLSAVSSAFLGLLMLSAKLLVPTFSVPLAEAGLALVLVSVASLLSGRGSGFALIPGIAALILLLTGGEITLAVLWGLTVLLLLFAADGRILVILSAFCVTVFLFFGYSRLFPADFKAANTGSLNLLVSAGWTGTDMLPGDLPSAASLFPRLSLHFGLLFAGLTVLLFLPLSLRGVFIATSSRTRFHAVISMGISLLLALQALAALLSVFGFLPLPEVCFPFLTSSLPDLCAELFMIGMLCGISARNEADLAEDAHLAMLAK